MSEVQFSDDEIVDELKSMLVKASDLLSHESIEAITHYINHDEYELAFEGMFLDLYELGVLPAGFDRQRCTDVAIALKLDRETVLDASFWEKFQNVVQSEGNSDHG